MKIIFDASCVSPDIHTHFVSLATALGYVVLDEGETLQFPRPPLTSDIIPTLIPFTVLKDSTIDIAKESLPMTSYCKTNLNEERFGGQVKVGSLCGGFIKMNRDYESKEGLDAVGLLVKQTRRKFRLGTALELLIFKQHHPLPQHCVALGSVWNAYVLCWDGLGGGSEFGLRALTGWWHSTREVFLVEDIESLESEMSGS